MVAAHSGPDTHDRPQVVIHAVNHPSGHTDGMHSEHPGGRQYAVRRRLRAIHARGDGSIHLGCAIDAKSQRGDFQCGRLVRSARPPALRGWPLQCARRCLRVVRAPQLGGDEDRLVAAEALWTAITSKRTPLIDASAAEIERLHTKGQLRDDAYETLSGVVASARAEDWDGARKSLKFLLSGQRREPPR